MEISPEPVYITPHLRTVLGTLRVRLSLSLSSGACPYTALSVAREKQQWMENEVLTV